MREEAGDEERDVPEALQRAVARAGGRGFERIVQHERERPQAHALGRVLVQRLRARKEREQIDDVLLGLFLYRHVLLGERPVYGVLEELPQIRDREYALCWLSHRSSPHCYVERYSPL